MEESKIVAVSNLQTVMHEMTAYSKELDILKNDILELLTEYANCELSEDGKVLNIN